MADFNKDLLWELFGNQETKEKLRQWLGENMSQLMEAELSTFLGYDPDERQGWHSGDSRNGTYQRVFQTTLGPVAVEVPRDRNGNFHQHTVPPHQQHTDDLEAMIIKMYAHGVGTNEIARLIKQMYGSYYSPAGVSNISQQMIPKVKAFHQRQLPSQFFCVYLDATYIPLRRETYAQEAVYVALGIEPNGHQQLLDYCIAPTENEMVWSELLQQLKQRGLKQIELFIADGCVSIKNALQHNYPAAHLQRCLVHVMRNLAAKVRVKDRQTVLHEFKQLHHQPNQQAALKVLHQFDQHWGQKYPQAIKHLKEIEPQLLTFDRYPQQIRSSIYSTNLIESFNSLIKRKTRPKASFPTVQSLDTFLGVQAMDYNSRYCSRVHQGFGQVQDTLSSYFS